MSSNEKSLKAYIERPEFPLASQYDPLWIIENQMGLNPILLTEWLNQVMSLKPGNRSLMSGAVSLLTNQRRGVWIIVVSR